MKISFFLRGAIPFIVLAIFFSCTDHSKSLWNGKDFNGWHFVLQDSSVTPAENWQIRDGVIHCSGKTYGYMRTEKEYENYELNVEWRWPEKPGNSGVLINMQGPDKVWPNCIECQLYAGDAGEFIIIGHGSMKVGDSLYVSTAKSQHIPKMHESSEKPAGEWNHYRIISTPDSIVCWVNGTLQNKGYNPSLKKGYILFQSEGAPIEFRNIALRSLQ